MKLEIKKRLYNLLDRSLKRFGEFGIKLIGRIGGAEERAKIEKLREEIAMHQAETRKVWSGEEEGANKEEVPSEPREQPSVRQEREPEPPVEPVKEVKTEMADGNGKVIPVDFRSRKRMR